jgi:hypothetical protein
MSRKNTIRTNMFGLWAFGVLVGANVAVLLPLDPAWPSGVLLAIGVLGSLGTSAALYQAVGDRKVVEQ